VRDFINAAAKELNIKIVWKDQGINEKGYWLGSYDGKSENLSLPHKPIVVVDPRYFRPTEVETLLGDASKAKLKLGWSPKITFEQLVIEMVREDFELTKRDEVVKKHGFKTMDHYE